MDEKLMESYLENIEEMIQDEGKIVTYKSLSKALEIHVNTAKQLLHTYLSNQNFKSSRLVSAIYLLAGKTENGNLKVCLVKEADLKEAYSRFIEITSEHVYSLQKISYVKCINALCIVNKELSDCKSYEVIKCSKSYTKGKEESKKNISEPSKENTSEAKTVLNHQTIINEEIIKKSGSPVKITNKSPFKDSPTKNCKKRSPIEHKSKVQVERDSSKQRKGTIANFFASVGKSSNNIQIKNEFSFRNKSNLAPGLNKKEIQIQKIITSNEVKQEIQIEKILKKKVSANKRKRVQILSDSEESDSSEEEPPHKKEEPEQEPAVRPVKLEIHKETKIENPPQSKGRRRKIVDKTVMNEDGYLVTSKEVVFDTDSSDENERACDAKKEIYEKKKHKLEESYEKTKKVASKGLTKQSSLLSFLKKN